MNQFVVARDTTRTIFTPTRLRVVRGWKWLRPLIKRFVDRWTEAEVVNVEHYRKFEVPNAPSLLERMHLSARDMERVYNQEARYAFVGPDVLHELQKEARARMMSLGSPPLEMSGPNGRLTIEGVEVVYVPWMEGALLVPEWESRKAALDVEQPAIRWRDDFRLPSDGR